MRMENNNYYLSICHQIQSNIENITSHNFQQIKEKEKKKKRGGRDNKIKSTNDSMIA